MSPVVFITGTDTGVGKSVLTGLLLQHLRRSGIRALAMKPFATGAPADARLLDRLQDRALAMDQLSPFHFREALAPWLAARRERRIVPLATAVKAICAVQRQSEVLLVEGCGGLLTPLGPGYSAREIIAALKCRVAVVAPNRLGVLNQVMLVLDALRSTKSLSPTVVLMEPRQPDPTSRSNVRALRELAAPTPIFDLPWLGLRAASLVGIRSAARKQRLLLAQTGSHLQI